MAVSRSAFQRKAQAASVPPPIGGWNDRDALDAMPPQDAVLLDNWFPRTHDVIVRNGFQTHCDTTEDSNFVKTLVEYHSGTTRKLIAAVNGKIYDVSTATPTSLKTGLSVDAWETAVFNGRLIMVNGTDAPQDYDGSTVSATSWTGPTIANLTDVHAFKSRLYFIEKNTQSAWYGGLNAITGALTEYDMSGVCNFGGTLVGMGTITNDGGEGVDDFLCFFFSSGEVAVYAGSDPAASNWALKGVFHIGAPINKRAIAKVGSDVVLVTQDGYVALTDVLPFGRSDVRTMSDKIVGAASRAVTAFAGNSGWAVCLYPKSDMLIVNVPRATTRFDQHVMNTRTGAWCRMRGMNGYSWALFNDHLYFGGADGIVYKADTGDTDNGESIIADGQQAWGYFGARDSSKRFTMVRPIFVSKRTPAIALGLSTDFDPSIKTTAVNFSPQPDVGVWDSAVWDSSIWGYGTPSRADWVSVAGIGFSASLRVRIASTQDPPRWQSTNYNFEMGIGY